MTSGTIKIMPAVSGRKFFVSTSGKRRNDTNETIPSQNNFSMFDTGLSNINKTLINFKGYYGDHQPAKKLFWNITGRNDIYEDNWTKEHLYQVGNKKWVNAYPNDILKRSLEQTIQSICTLTKPPMQYPGIPSYIPSPKIGGYESDKWGRHANYIEINPRLVAKYENGTISEGLFGVLKLLTAIPPSAKNFANCIIISQLYPTIYGDGTTNDTGLYCANLHEGISKNLTVPGLYGKMGEDEQVKAFNDLAHLMGFKTGIRMPLSAGQLRVHGQAFDWYHHEKAYIDACTWAIELGFDAIYFDSGKHIIDMNGYSGIGDVPNKAQMAYILNKIRCKTGRTDISFIGEKCTDDYQYKEMGFTAGTDWGRADDINSVLWETRKQSYNREYAAGPEVSNDNDYGGMNYEQRIHRLKSNLFGYDHINNKLPTFMQIHDIFPLSPYINTHETMEHPHQMRGSDAWTECERHWDGVFSTAGHARNYTQAVYHEFEQAMYR